MCNIVLFIPNRGGGIPLPPTLPLMQMDDLDHLLFGLEKLLVHLTHSTANGYGRQLQDGGGWKFSCTRQKLLLVVTLAALLTQGRFTQTFMCWGNREVTFSYWGEKRLWFLFTDILRLLQTTSRVVPHAPVMNMQPAAMLHGFPPPDYHPPGRSAEKPSPQGCVV